MEISSRSVKAKNLRRAAGQAMQQLYLASRLHLMYSDEHENVRAAIDALAQRLAEVFTVEAALKVSIEGGYLFANGIRLRVDSIGDKGYEWLVGRFAESGISSVLVRSSVKPVELRKLLPIFGKVMWVEDAPPPPVQQMLVDAFVMNISVTMRSKLALDEDDERIEVSAREVAVGLYFKMIRAAQELAETVASGGRVSLKPLRYLVQLAVDTFLEDEVALLPLTRVKNHKSYLANHLANACVYALALGNRIGLSRRQLLDLGTAALSFDVGMALVPKAVREKPVALQPADREALQKHPLLGADALLRAEEHVMNRICAVVAAEHHLKGYPRAVDGPPGLLTSIVAIADAYDSLTTDRPFRRGMPHGEALHLIYRGDGGHDRLLVKAFANVLGIYPVGVLVELEGGAFAVVARENPDPRLWARPRVKVLVGPDGKNVDGTLVDTAERDPEGRFVRSIARVVELERGRTGPRDLLSLI